MTRSPGRTLASLPLFGAAATVLAALVVALFMIGLLASGQIVAIDWSAIRGMDRELLLLLNTGTMAAAGLAAALVTRYWLGVPAQQLGLPVLPGALPEITIGIALGAVPILLAGALYVATGGEVQWTPGGRAEAIRSIAIGLCVFAPSALGEEWVFRHYFLSALVPHIGRLPAIGAGALLFALVHLPGAGGASVLALVDIFVVGAGLGFAYVVTGSLWIPWMWHLAWNFTMGSILGLSVSGQGVPSVAVVRSMGPDWWTGGLFGPEASLTGVVVGALAVASFWVISRHVPAGVWTGTAAE